MSSILKALEKLEESQGLGSELAVIAVNSSAGRTPSWVVPVGVLIGAIFAALLTFAFMGGFSRSIVPVRKVELSVAAGPKVELSVAARPKVELSVAARPKVTAAPMPPTLPQATRSHARRHAAAVSAKRPVHLSRSHAPKAPARGIVSMPRPAAPEIRVTGIAWQKEAASSAALVNGRPVQEGDMVSGLKVEKIFSDKVRFANDKGSLDVPLGGGK